MGRDYFVHEFNYVDESAEIISKEAQVLPIYPEMGSEALAQVVIVLVKRL